MSDVRLKALSFVELCSHGRVADYQIVLLYGSGLVVARRRVFTPPKTDPLHHATAGGSGSV